MLSRLAIRFSATLETFFMPSLVIRAWTPPSMTCDGGMPNGGEPAGMGLIAPHPPNEVLLHPVPTTTRAAIATMFREASVRRMDPPSSESTTTKTQQDNQEKTGEDESAHRPGRRGTL